MKKALFILLIVVSFAMLLAVESAPSAVVGYVKYPCVAGLNYIALPMDAGYTMASEFGDANPDMMDAINYWDSATQSWVAATFIGIWLDDFAIQPGSVLMVSATTPFNAYSIGALPATNASYGFVAGLNSLMVPLNRSSLTLASEIGDEIGVLDAINYWDNSTQTWVAATNIGIWLDDFSVSIGMPLFASATDVATWPVRGRMVTTPTSSLRTSK